MFISQSRDRRTQSTPEFALCLHPVDKIVPVLASSLIGQFERSTGDIAVGDVRRLMCCKGMCFSGWHLDDIVCSSSSCCLCHKDSPDKSQLFDAVLNEQHDHCSCVRRHESARWREGSHVVVRVDSGELRVNVVGDVVGV